MHRWISVLILVTCASLLAVAGGYQSSRDPVAQAAADAAQATANAANVTGATSLATGQWASNGVVSVSGLVVNAQATADWASNSSTTVSGMVVNAQAAADWASNSSVTVSGLVVAARITTRSFAYCPTNVEPWILAMEYTTNSLTFLELAGLGYGGTSVWHCISRTNGTAAGTWTTNDSITALTTGSTKTVSFTVPARSWWGFLGGAYDPASSNACLAATYSWQ